MSIKRFCGYLLKGRGHSLKTLEEQKINKQWQNLFVVDEMTKKEIESRREVVEGDGLA
jgi:hypothetical protein